MSQHKFLTINNTITLILVAIAVATTVKALSPLYATMQSGGIMTQPGLYISNVSSTGPWYSSIPINWGTILQSNVYTQTFWLNNTGTSTLTLALSTSPTPAPEGSYVLSIVSIGPGSTIQETLTLDTASTYTGSFATTITLTGT
jgi:hypothetical protein